MVAMSPISVNPNIMSGAPCFTGTRVPIKSLFDWLGRNYTIDDFMENFPSVNREQVLAVLELARQTLETPVSTR
jgi:uncharacterized protein (DUF433 family)